MAKSQHKNIQSKIQKPATVKKTVAAETPDAKATSMTEKNFILVTLCAFIVIGFIGVFHHEMWRDEMQIWLLGASNHSFSEFIHNMNGEPTPLLWILINFVISRISDAPIMTQIAHLIISVGSVYLILKYAPFNRVQRVLLCFSYYVLFEYTLIARGYGLTVFFLFLFCALYQFKTKNRYLFCSLALVGLANGAGGEGIILTISLLGMMVIDYLFSEDVSIRRSYKPIQFLLGIGIALLGIYIAMKWLTPPAGNTYGNKWVTNFDMERLQRTTRIFWMSFLPIPNLNTINFWNSNLFYSSDTGSFAFSILAIFSLTIFTFCILQYSKKLSIIAFYLAATGCIMLFCYANNVIFTLFAVRHYGFLFIAFIAAAWLAPGVKKTTFGIPGLNSFRNMVKVEKNFTYLLTCLLCISALGGAIAYAKDFSLRFSNIKSVGEYITSHNLDKIPETGFIDYSVSPIAAYTKQPIYFPDRDTSATYTTWDEKKFSFDLKVLLSRLTNFISKQKDSVLYISTGDYFGIGEGKVIGNIQFTRIASFYDCVVPDENYVLYIARNFDLNKDLLDPNVFKNPTEINNILSSANQLLQNGKLDEAEKILNTVKEKTNGAAVPHLHNYIGILNTKKNMTHEAEDEFNTEIKLNLVKEEAYFNLGMLYYQNKDYAKAITALDSTISIGPKNADAYSYLGVIYANFKKDFGKGKTYFEKVVELNPNFTEGYMNILVCAQNSNDEQSLIKYTRILLDKGTSIADIRAKGINISDDILKKINAR